MHEIECWLLPVYFKTQPKKAAKINGCTETLNTILPQKEGFYIHAKDPRHYQKMAKHFRKNILQVYRVNISLKIFVERVLEIKDMPSDEESNE